METSHTAGRAVTKSADAVRADAEVAAYVSPTLNFDSFAKSLFDADWSTLAETASIKQSAINALAQSQGSFLERLQIAALDVPGMTAAQWDVHIAPSLKASYLAQDYKAGPSRAALVKVAVLAFAHGVKIPQGMESNFQNFVNKVARPELQERGILDVTGKGRKSGSTQTKEKGPSAREQAAMCLAQTGGIAEDVVQRRMLMLLTLSTTGYWKLLDKALEEAMRHTGK